MTKMTDQDLGQALRSLLEQADPADDGDPAGRVITQLAAILGQLGYEADGMGDLGYYRDWARRLEALVDHDPNDDRTVTIVYRDAVAATIAETPGRLEPASWSGVLRVQKGDRDYWAHVWTCLHTEADAHPSREAAIDCATAAIAGGIGVDPSHF